MSHESPETTPAKTSWSWEILKRLNQVSESDLAQLKTKILPDYLDLFEKMSHNEQVILAIIDQLSETELDDIMRAENSHLLGLHKIINYIQTIYSMTDDARYQKYIEPEQ